MLRRWLFLTCLFAGPALAQDEPNPATPGFNLDTPRDTVTLNPLVLLTGNIVVEYERVLSPALSVFVGPRLKLFNGLWGPLTGFGGGLRFGARWYYRETAPTQLFTHVVADLAYYLPPNGPGFSGLSFDLGAGAGYALVIDPNWVLSIGADLFLLQGGTLGGVFSVTGAFDPELRFAFGLTF